MKRAKKGAKEKKTFIVNLALMLGDRVPCGARVHRTPLGLDDIFRPPRRGSMNPRSRGERQIFCEKASPDLGATAGKYPDDLPVKWGGELKRMACGKEGITPQ